MRLKIKVLSIVMGAVLGMAGVGGISSAYAYCPVPTSESHPDYESNCGIWICLPGGFPSDCSKQKDAFYKRLRNLSCAPLPSYTLCTGSSDAGISATRRMEEIERGDGYIYRRYVEIDMHGNIYKFYY